MRASCNTRQYSTSASETVILSRKQPASTGAARLDPARAFFIRSPIGEIMVKSYFVGVHVDRTARHAGRPAGRVRAGLRSAASYHQISNMFVVTSRRGFDGEPSTRRRRLAQTLPSGRARCWPDGLSRQPAASSRNLKMVRPSCLPAYRKTAADRQFRRKLRHEEPPRLYISAKRATAPSRRTARRIARRKLAREGRPLSPISRERLQHAVQSFSPRNIEDLDLRLGLRRSLASSASRLRRLGPCDDDGHRSPCTSGSLTLGPDRLASARRQTPAARALQLPRLRPARRRA